MFRSILIAALLVALIPVASANAQTSTSCLKKPAFAEVTVEKITYYSRHFSVHFEWKTGELSIFKDDVLWEGLTPSEKVSAFHEYVESNLRSAEMVWFRFRKSKLVDVMTATRIAEGCKRTTVTFAYRPNFLKGE